MGEVPDYSLGWDDTDKTIIMLHVTKRLSWTQVQEAIDGVNDMIRSVPHDVYTVYYLENDGKRAKKYKLKFSKSGEIKGAPKGFFDTYMIDVMDIALES